MDLRNVMPMATPNITQLVISLIKIDITFLFYFTVHLFVDKTNVKA